MRHGKKFNHLGRQTAHRKAMLANMACSLIEHKRINTTVAKAKALRKFVEPFKTTATTKQCKYCTFGCVFFVERGICLIKHITRCHA